MKEQPFKKIEGCYAILIKDGMYSQHNLCDLNGDVFAQVQSRFVRLYNNGSTSTLYRIHCLALTEEEKDKITFDELSRCVRRKK